MDNLEKLLKNLQNIEEKLSNGFNDGMDLKIEEELANIFGEVQKTEKLVVGVKLLEEGAVPPKYGKDGDAGADLTITSIKTESTTEITYGFGIALEIPKGYVGLLFPRSSIRDTKLSLKNCVGVIDSNYRGEIMASFRKNNEQSLKQMYEIKERGAQLIIIPYPEINYVVKNELGETNRGSGGFGSSN